jgi:glycosyltransferase involved in cell wall biosynthesis
VSLFEAIVELIERERPDVAIEGIVQPEAAAHFSPRAREYLSHTPRLSNRVVRVAYENVLLPRRLRQRRAEALINPIFAGPVRGARRIVTIVPDLYFRTIPHLMEPSRRRYLALAVPRMVAASNAVIAISDSTAREIRAAWPEAAARVVTVHPAARELPPAAPLTWPRPYVLCVAVVLPNKNISCIVAAIAQLNATGHAVDLLHIGADPENLLAAAIADNDAEDLVHSLGAADDEALASAYRGALALVIASLDEGFCLPVLEAQISGTPVCTTPCGALREVAGEAALFFNPDQPELLASHVQLLLQDPEYRANIAQAGRANAVRFGWQKTAAGVLAQALASVTPGSPALGQARNTQSGEWQSAGA